MNSQKLRDLLFEGLVIPAIPLALHADGSFDQRHQKALLRYYIDAGAGGIAAAVHTTQFEIRQYKSFFENFLSLVSQEIDSYSEKQGRTIIKIGGICGPTSQAVHEAQLLGSKGYDAGLLSLSAFKDKTTEEILTHCREVAGHLPLFGFYLQPAVGGINLSRKFWKEFARIPNVIGIKVAPFNRYKTLDVMQALAASGRQQEVALYTGNDDSIVFDLIADYPFRSPEEKQVQFSGGLLGQWCVWTHQAFLMLEEIKHLKRSGRDIPKELIERAHKITDANSAIFDAHTNYAGVIPGVHEILRRQGLLSSRRCLDPELDLSDGQMEEIERVLSAYPELQDGSFINAHIDEWLKE